MNSFINADRETILAFIKHEVDGPFQMLNLLKFKDHVAETGLTGQEQYQNYLRAATPFVEKSGAELKYLAKPIFSIIGPHALEWDKILLVEYPTKEAFINMITNPEYPAHLRTLALSDSRLILCQ